VAERPRHAREALRVDGSTARGDAADPAHGDPV
jgi:hypothetical protein